MHDTLRIVSVLSQVVVLAAGLSAIRSLTNEMKILVVYFAVALSADLIGSYLSFQDINNLWLFHIFTIVEYGFFIFVFSIWQKNRALRKILRTSIPLFTILGITSMLFLESVHHFNSISKPVASLVLVVAAAYTLLELNKESFYSVFRQSRFWISAAVLLYFSSTLVLFAIGNLLLGFPVETLRLTFMFHSTMNIIANTLYTGGFLCRVQAQKSGGY